MHGSALLQSIRRKTGNLAGLASPERRRVQLDARRAQWLCTTSIPLPQPNSAKMFVNASEARSLHKATEHSCVSKLWGRTANAVAFPWSAIEVKAIGYRLLIHWSHVQLPDKNLYTETITALATAGWIAFSSKARPDWVWATFEPPVPLPTRTAATESLQRCSTMGHDIQRTLWQGPDRAAKSTIATTHGAVSPQSGSQQLIFTAWQNQSSWNGSRFRSKFFRPRIQCGVKFRARLSHTCHN